MAVFNAGPWVLAGAPMAQLCLGVGDWEKRELHMTPSVMISLLKQDLLKHRA
jgi:hypothetical protein